MSTRARSTATAFAKDERGNIAVIFAIALLPLLSFIGAAVDYTRASSSKASMQSALDSATLMAAKDAANLSAAELSTKAEGYFRAMYTRAEMTGVEVITVYTVQSGSTPASVLMTSSGDMTTEFMGIIGFKKMTLKTSSTASWANTKLRVALALDVTGSMDYDGKMNAMQTQRPSWSPR